MIACCASLEAIFNHILVIISGIPIDMVGGTSMGAFIGALYADDACSFNTIQRARSTSVV